jgi:hypothetical protein
MMEVNDNIKLKDKYLDKLYNIEDLRNFLKYFSLRKKASYFMQDLFELKSNLVILVNPKKYLLNTTDKINQLAFD